MPELRRRNHVNKGVRSNLRNRSSASKAEGPNGGAADTITVTQKHGGPLHNLSELQAPPLADSDQSAETHNLEHSSRSRWSRSSIANTMCHLGADKAYWAQVTSHAEVLESESEDGSSVGSIESETHSVIDLQKLGSIDMEMQSTDQNRFSEPLSTQGLVSRDSRSSVGGSYHVSRENTGILIDSSRRAFSKTLSSRVGSLNLRFGAQGIYYGASSNFHFTRNAVLSASLYPSLLPSSNGESALALLGLSWTQDSVYEERLNNMFFEWHNPAIHALQRSSFDDGKRKFMAGRSNQQYSLSLANAVLALGALYLPDKNHSSIPKTQRSADFFAHRARILLENELDTPTLATIQALLLLSHFEAAEARDTRGWVYSGMAVQLVSEMALDADIDTDGWRDGELSNLDFRRTVLQAALSSHIFWCCLTGRPSHLSACQFRSSMQLGGEEWNVPDEDAAAEATAIPAQSAEQVAQYSFELCKLVHRILTLFYDHTTMVDGKSEQIAVNISDSLEKWLASLPITMQIPSTGSKTPSSILPWVIELHMQYHAAVILLSRPFLMYPDDATIAIPNSNQCKRKTSEICTKSASEVCRLVELFRVQHGLRHLGIPAIYYITAAGAVHTENYCKAREPTQQESQISIFTCIQALGESSQTFRTSFRSMDLLNALRRDWQEEVLSP